jgi:arginine deiminase
MFALNRLLQRFVGLLKAGYLGLSTKEFNMPLNIHSEIAPLKTVIVHQPGYEHRKTVPWNKDALLFDDLIDLDAARQEHKDFSLLLAQHGVEVLFLLDLLKEVCLDRDTRDKVYSEILPERVQGKIDFADLQPWHLVHGYPEHTLLSERSLLRPLPNLYFMRDPAFAVPGAMIISHPFWPARKIESRLMRAIFRYHPRFAGMKVWDGLLDMPGTHVEGGDVLVADSETLLVGISERTNEAGADALADWLFANTPVRRVLKIWLPAKREFMHLDTVMTFVDHQRILTMPYLWDRCDLYADIAENAMLLCERLGHAYTGPMPEELRAGTRLEIRERGGKITHYERVLEGMSECGLINPDWTVTVAGAYQHHTNPEEHVVEALREQWNDAANSFALKAGQVLCYDRNVGTLRALEEAHVEVVRFAGSDLVRGRGGARCMTCPIHRESL